MRRCAPSRRAAALVRWNRPFGDDKDDTIVVAHHQGGYARAR